MTIASVLGSLALGPQWPRSDARLAARAAAAALQLDSMPAAAAPPNFTTAQRAVAATPALGAATDGRILRRVQLR